MFQFRQHWSLRLGQYFRCRYDGVFSRGYAISNLLCNSSATDRTVNTATAVLEGIYPRVSQKPWDPVPCFSIDATLDNVFKCGKKSKQILHFMSNFRKSKT